MTISGQAGGKVVAVRGAFICAALLAASVVAIPAIAATVSGSSGPDYLRGTKRSDLIRRRQNADVLIGRADADTLRGAKGKDRVRAGKGEDALRGGKSADVLRARDGSADLLDCGPGVDIAYVDVTEDGVFDCEEVIEPDAEARN